MLRSLTRGFKLAWSDLRYEWAMTLCVVFSLAAMFAPLIILLGLQNGIVNTLMDRMRGDPYNLQVRPQRIMASGLEAEWFDDMRQRPDVGWISPTLRGMAMSVDISSGGGAKLFPADMEPSAPGDLLLTSNGVQVPSKGEVVLSHALADKLEVMEGESVTLSIRRSDLAGKADLRVVGIAPLNVSYDKDLMWVDFSLVSAVETYVSGGAVAELGWKGVDQNLDPKYDGGIVLTLDKIPPKMLARLYRRSGFDHSDLFVIKNKRTKLCEEFEKKLIQREQKRNGETLASSVGLKGNSQLHSFLFRATNNTIRSEKLDLLRSILEEHDIDCEVIPWVENLDLTLTYENKNEVSVSGITNPQMLRTQESGEISRIVVSKATLEKLGPEGYLVAMSEGKELKIPCLFESSKNIPEGVAYLTPWLSGVLRVASEKSIVLKNGEAYVKDRKLKYTGFRLYAESLEDLNGLVSHLKNQNIDVSANLDQVHRVQKISSYMSQLYSAIAGILGIAAFLAIAANLYANVQRRKRALAYLQLLGSSRFSLIWYPLFKSLGLVIGGLLGAFIAYYAFGVAVDNTLSSSLKAGESFVKLSELDVQVFIAAVLLTSMFASLIAALTVLRVDPAEAMRED